MPPNSYEFKDYEIYNSNSKIVKFMKFTSKTGLNHLLLSITSNDKYWRCQLDFLHSSIQHYKKIIVKKKPNLNNKLVLCLGFWLKICGFMLKQLRVPTINNLEFTMFFSPFLHFTKHTLNLLYWMKTSSCHKTFT